MELGGAGGSTFVIGAALVIFMQAGFALVETGFCRAKHAAHVVQHQLRHLRPRLRRLLPRRLRVDVRWLQLRAAGLRLRPDTTTAIGSGALISRCGRLGLPVEGRLGRLVLRRPRTSPSRRGHGLLPLHGGLHGHHGHDPDRVDGRAVEVEELRALGPVLRRHLLPAVRCLDLGRRLAGQLGNSHGPRQRLRRLRRLRRRARRRWRGRPRRCHRARPRIGKFGKDGKPRALPGHHIPMAMLGTFILLFGWFGFNAASTLRRDRPAVRRRRRQHGHRRCLRARSWHVLDLVRVRASPIPA